MLAERFSSVKTDHSAAAQVPAPVPGENAGWTGRHMSKQAHLCLAEAGTGVAPHLQTAADLRGGATCAPSHKRCLAEAGLLAGLAGRGFVATLVAESSSAASWLAGKHGATGSWFARVLYRTRGLEVSHWLADEGYGRSCLAVVQWLARGGHTASRFARTEHASRWLAGNGHAGNRLAGLENVADGLAIS